MPSPSMTGSQPIEYYYPQGYGELNLVEQDESLSSRTGDIQWLTPAILNKSYNETSPSRPIFEQQNLVRPEDPDVGCKTSIRLRAAYVSYVGAPPTTGGNLKYAIVSGVFPPSVTLNIDTGDLYGKIDDLDDIYSDTLGAIDENLENEPARDIEAANTFGFDYGEQGPRRFTEDNYGAAGSAALHGGGFPIPKGVIFIARAFDSSLTSRYIDGQFTIDLSNNWSSDRDAFILNIRNQMFVDGKPVTNKEYLATMKARGYFPNC